MEIIINGMQFDTLELADVFGDEIAKKFQTLCNEIESISNEPYREEGNPYDELYTVEEELKDRAFWQDMLDSYPKDKTLKTVEEYIARKKYTVPHCKMLFGRCTNIERIQYAHTEDCSYTTSAVNILSDCMFIGSPEEWVKKMDLEAANKCLKNTGDWCYHDGDFVAGFELHNFGKKVVALMLVANPNWTRDDGTCHYERVRYYWTKSLIADKATELKGKA